MMVGALRAPSAMPAILCGGHPDTPVPQTPGASFAREGRSVPMVETRTRSWTLMRELVAAGHLGHAATVFTIWGGRTGHVGYRESVRCVRLLLT